MKIKTMFLALMLMVTASCAFVAQSARADNDGDYTPTTHAQWWWKYVRPQQKWGQILKISTVAIEKEVVNARTEKVSNVVVFTLVNKSDKPVECDGSVSIAHTVRDKDGSVIYTEELLPARLPKTLRPGESFQGRVTATTPSKLKGSKQYLALTAH